jgi:Zn-dependent protease
MDNTEPGQLIEILADNRTFRIRLVADPDNENRGYLGVIAMPALPRSAYLDPRTALGGAVSVILGGAVFHPWFYDAVVPWAVIDLLKWLFALNLLVGLFNLLPAKPLDGGYIFEALLERRTTRERARKITKVLSYVVLVLILLNLIPRIRGWLG